MNHVRDPGPEAVEKILGTLEDLSLPPTDVARQSRRLRAHIQNLRRLLREARDAEIWSERLIGEVNDVLEGRG